MQPANPYKLFEHFREKGHTEMADDMELEFYRWEAAAERANDIVRDIWSEDEEDFWFQMEQETKRQWEEDLERERLKKQW